MALMRAISVTIVHKNLHKLLLLGRLKIHRSYNKNKTNMRKETGDKRKETGDKIYETGDVRQETCDKRFETGDMRQEK